mmetsp:Transcript_19629/g.40027  ORF Transcript_19629/g.40027 Transcript_19629/m.40027 type:complete len:212 (-) Transcript_19629:85-720(-)
MPYQIWALRPAGMALRSSLLLGRRGCEQLDLRLELGSELLEGLIRGFVLGRKAFLHSLVLRLRLLQRVGQLDDLGIPPLLRHGCVLLQLCKVLRRAVLLVVHVARRAKALSVLAQRFEVPATLVLLALEVVRAREGLDGWVSLNPILLAQRLAGRCAVDISDEHLLGIAKLFGELVPVWLHRLAVASPRRQELDEGRLASDRALPVVLRKL